MKNIKSTNKARTTNSNEGYGLGSSKDGCDSKRKPLTAWAVEIDGEIYPDNIVSTRAYARSIRNNVAGVYGSDAKASVRKVMIVAVSGR